MSLIGEWKYFIVYQPTNVIFGVAVTFLATATGTVGVIGLTPPGFTKFVAVGATPVLAKDVVVVESTTGFVDGIGFPSLV